VPVHRAYRKKIYMMEIIEKENIPFIKEFQAGVDVLALYHDDQEYYPAEIVEVMEDENYFIKFKDYDCEQEICLGQMK